LLIFAQADSGDLAARVANDFALSILEAGAEGQTARTREAQAFFREEEARVSAEMLALEAEVAAFRNAQADALPGQADLRRAEFLALEAGLRGLGQERAALEDEAARIAARGDLRETDRRQLALIEDRRAALAAQEAALSDRRAAIEAAMARDARGGTRAGGVPAAAGPVAGSV
jgi:tyrosine-protein kinase Etk/Wzc